ncbi:related to Protein OS-9 homolog [Phialocephala subalpina]|uniref:Endoplasmic reticulum lectin n=1 Tax=Phialocephala subalpina TaxID=576137 RepID=A0A1L7WZL5_9HELO|nr:related to Protein OS-9 homolog [Phialocephala subalpina]
MLVLKRWKVKLKVEIEIIQGIPRKKMFVVASRRRRNFDEIAESDKLDLRVGSFRPIEAKQLMTSGQFSGPQYEVIFSESLISDAEASLIVEQASSAIHEPPQSSTTNGIQSQHGAPGSGPSADVSFDPAHETYEYMYLNGEQHLCTIPIVDTPPKNETSAAEARAAEQKELARATDKGWELLQDLEGNCLYFVSGWWSYSFCYNNEITQFHQLPPQPGKPLLPPQRDPTTKQFVLGKANGKEIKEDEWGNQIDIHKGKQVDEPPKTELQVKGDSRYLVQKMDGGTTCDLTGKPRRVEVQFHCNPHVSDRIGYIKEVTTCSYLMVVYTPRLCSDVAFMPPKETKANPIVCRVVVPEKDIDSRREMKLIDEKKDELGTQEKKPNVNIGGLVVGAGKWMNKDGARMPIPKDFGKEDQGKVIEVIATAKSKAEGGKIEMISESDMQKIDLEPEMVEQLKHEVQKMAKEKGWRIEVVDEPGHVREILGIVDEDEGDDAEGSEEVFYQEEL